MGLYLVFYGALDDQERFFSCSCNVSRCGGQVGIFKVALAIYQRQIADITFFFFLLKKSFSFVGFLLHVQVDISKSRQEKIFSFSIFKIKPKIMMELVSRRLACNYRLLLNRSNS